MPDRSAYRMCSCPQCRGTGSILEAPDPAQLIPAIADSKGLASHEFYARELLDYAQRNGGPLLAALNGVNAKKLGKLLLSVEGVDFDGARIERLTDDRVGVLWAIRLRV